MQERLLICLTLLLCCTLLHASARPAAAAGPPFATPNCPAGFYADEVALFRQLIISNYACTEEIARALRPRASSATVTALLRLIDSSENTLARRNAVRLLGRLAEGQPGERLRDMVAQHRAAEVQAVLLRRLALDRDLDVLQDLVWIFDTFYYPAFVAQPDFMRISADTSLDPASRTRATAAAGRLIFARGGALPQANLNFALAAIQAAEPGVRSEAALIAMRFRDEQLEANQRAQVLAALEAAWQREGPVMRVEAAPLLRAEPGRDVVESLPTAVTARASLARALDRYHGNSALLDQMEAEFEALNLPNTLRGDGIVIRSGLPTTALPHWLTRMVNTRQAFFDLVGVREPLPDDTNDTITLVLLANRAAYRDYMRSFVGFGADTDGLYVEARGALYTFQRGPGESENTVEESVQHELTHYLTGRYLFPGGWLDPGYHDQPKGWADEGLAESLAETQFDASGNAQLLPRQRHMQTICGQAAYRSLPDLLAMRAGYDQFGQFDYAHAWAFVYYLILERREALPPIYQSFRDGRYSPEVLPGLAGFDSMASLDAAWHGAMQRWCGK
ncbi:MAG: collagenase [Chloroflexaceae bacterium]|nr:collagenase [Chloroflexaceae bacterium]